MTTDASVVSRKSHLAIMTLAGMTIVMVLAGFVYMVKWQQPALTETAHPTIGTDSSLIKKQTAKPDNSNKPAKEIQREVPMSYTTESLPFTESLESSYPVNKLKRYTITISDGMKFELTVAEYNKKTDGELYRAIIYLPAEKDKEGNVTDPKKIPENFRYEKWQVVSQAINQYTNKSSLFISYWDNAQRIQFFTGRESWVTQPANEAYPDLEERGLWKKVAGGFDQQGRSVWFNKLLLTDMDQAICNVKNTLPVGRDHYMLFSTDDLSHVQEIATLNNRGLPLETRLFPADGDLHNTISQVKEWADQGEGTGSYLAQNISDRKIRVWRITDKRFEDTMLARVLPFTSSLDRSDNNLKLVYQSDWGGYISVYQIMYEGSCPENQNSGS